MQRFILCLLVLNLGFSANQSRAAERILLRGGMTLEAPVLKQNDEVLIADLGYTALSIPLARVLQRTPVTAEALSSPSPAVSGLYTVDRLTPRPTSESARDVSPAVLVVRSPTGQGSGFFVNKDGFLITNFHVIRGQKRISVTRFLEAEGMLRRITYDDVHIVASDPFHDLAVLRVDEEAPLPCTVLAMEKSTRFGESIFVIGNPLGLERSVTQGIISQVARNFSGQLFLQIDAPVNPGNSGGPLFNERGEVIGVINMGIPSMEGLNFAIPVRHVKFLLDHLEAYAYDATNPESGFIYPDPPPRARHADED